MSEFNLSWLSDSEQQVLSRVGLAHYFQGDANSNLTKEQAMNLVSALCDVAHDTVHLVGPALHTYVVHHQDGSVGHIPYVGAFFAIPWAALDQSVAAVMGDFPDDYIADVYSTLHGRDITIYPSLDAASASDVIIIIGDVYGGEETIQNYRAVNKQVIHVDAANLNALPETINGVMSDKA